MWGASRVDGSQDMQIAKLVFLFPGSVNFWKAQLFHPLDERFGLYQTIFMFSPSNHLKYLPKLLVLKKKNFRNQICNWS